MSANTTELIKGIMHPGLIMMVMGVLVMLLPRVLRRPLTVISPVLAAWAFLRLPEESTLTCQPISYANLELLHIDNLSYAFTLIFCLAAVLYGLYGEGLQNRFESGISMIYAGSMMGVILAGDCISFTIFWGIAAAASAFESYSVNNGESAGASYRFILMHIIGVMLMMTGFMIYMFHYGNDPEQLRNCSSEPCFWLIAAGAAVSAAIPPVHTWLTDACPEATESGAVYLSSFTTKAGLFVIIRLLAGTEMLVWAGAAAAVYGAVLAIMENDIRKVISYNLVSQTGIIIAAAGAGGKAGINAASAHAITSVITIGVLMMCAGIIMRVTDKSRITDLGGLALKMPLTAGCFLIASLSIAALPGSAGFVSMTMISDVLSDKGYTVQGILVTAGSIGSLLSVTLGINKSVFFGKCSEPEKSDVLRKTPVTALAAIAIGAAALILSGLLPQKLFEILPYAVKTHPYSAAHVLEYCAAIIGGAIPYFLISEKMKPDDKITLDLDWIYRKPVHFIMKGLSAAAEKLFAFRDETAGTE